MLNIGFLSHVSTLFPSFLHHLCLQFLYPTNFLVRECFSSLALHFVSSNFNFIVDDICKHWQVLTSYSYDVASSIEDRALIICPPPPLPPSPSPTSPTSITVTTRRPLLFRISMYRTREDSNSSSVSILDVYSRDVVRERIAVMACNIHSRDVVRVLVIVFTSRDVVQVRIAVYGM